MHDKTRSDAKRHLESAAVLFGVPVFGLVAGEGLLLYLENQFAEAAAKLVGRNAELPTLRSSCEQPRFRSAAGAICETHDHIMLMRDASLWVAFAAMVLVAAIWAAARLAQGNRRLLAVLFAPGVKLVLLALFAMIVVQGAILAYGVYIVEAIAIHRVHYVLVGAMAIGAAIGAVMMISAGFRLSRQTPVPAMAVEIQEHEQPGIWKLVSDIADKLGARRPAHLIVGLEPTFYATASDVALIGSSTILSGETVYVSLPLMRLLATQEFAAVIAHELGHFKGEDTVYSLRFVPIYKSLGHALHSLSGHEGASSFALIPAATLLGFFLERFAIAERGIGRQRELEADRAGASVAGEEPLASALIKVSTCAAGWQFVRSAMADALDHGKTLTNASRFLRLHVAEVLQAADKSQLLSEIATSRLDHPTDTHPPLAERLKALGIDVADGSRWLVLGEQTAIDILMDAERIEEGLTDSLAGMFLRLGYASLPDKPD
ncbi:M48 family metallopeptidase [Vineibacter terrae]|uniref:M48 family metallopeptidase n=1 Tax=Vineibacter terrae TaxID=2586908 RepID=UPI002E324E6D|nr:M48 family metallopeptidase [Vineibacter terrae]HEX2890935.1 M48 family metallopeptidase [Vineibacter terrae]